jgi:hypothetical protein
MAKRLKGMVTQFGSKGYGFSLICKTNKHFKKDNSLSNKQKCEQYHDCFIAQTFA